MVHFDPLVKKMSDVNHLSGPLRKGKFSSTGSKGHCLWFVIDGFRSVFCVSVFQGSLLAILLWPKPDVNIPNIFDRFHPWTGFRLTFWDRKSAIKFRAGRAFFPTCLLPCTRRSHGRHSPRFACLLTLFTLARIDCVPIAHLRQNKPFPLLYLGHAQIISTGKIERFLYTVICLNQ